MSKEMMSKFACWIFGHQMFVVQTFSKTSRRIACDRCRGEWGMNDDARAVIEWTPELAEMYRSFGHHILNR